MEDTNPYLEAALYKGDPKTPIIEPLAPHTDEWGREILASSCFDVLRNDDGTVVMNDDKPVIYLKYPDIYQLASNASSHLSLLMHLTWSQAQAALLHWEGLCLEDLLIKYDREPEAMNILKNLAFKMWMAIHGGSMEGSHQNFLGRYMGSEKRLQIDRGEQRK